jgi:hypothetical protein
VLPSLFGGLAVAVVACVAVLFTARNASEFPLAYVIAIAIVQVTVALALALREIIYWTRELNRILQIEVLFWACFATIVFSVWLFQLPIATTLIMVLGVAVLRLALFGVSAGRVAR